MQQILSIIDTMSLKLNGLAWVLVAISANDIGVFFAIAASLSTVFYNWYRYKKEIYVYSDGTVSTATRQNASKVLVCYIRVFTDGSIERIK